MSIDAIRERLAKCPIPLDAQADWDGTNHYEITTPANSDAEDGPGYWWLDCLDEMFHNPRDWSATTTGKRLGACLDYAVAYKRDVTELLAEIKRRGEALEKYGEHIMPCPRWSREIELCTCGLDELRKGACK